MQSCDPPAPPDLTVRLTSPAGRSRFVLPSTATLGCSDAFFLVQVNSLEMLRILVYIYIYFWNVYDYLDSLVITILDDFQEWSSGYSTFGSDGIGNFPEARRSAGGGEKPLWRRVRALTDLGGVSDLSLRHLSKGRKKYVDIAGNCWIYLDSHFTIVLRVADVHWAVCLSRKNIWNVLRWWKQVATRHFYHSLSLGFMPSKYLRMKKVSSQMWMSSWSDATWPRPQSQQLSLDRAGTQVISGQASQLLTQLGIVPCSALSLFDRRFLTLKIKTKCQGQWDGGPPE